MRQLFIMDLETTGTLLSDAILELAFLQLTRDGHFYRPGKYYRRVFHYSFPPESLFSRTHHAALHDECRYAETATPSAVEDSIEDYFKACGSDHWQSRIMVGSRLFYKLEMLDRCRYLLKPQLLEFDSGPKQVGGYGSIMDLYSIGSFVGEMFGENRQVVEKKFAELKLEGISPFGHRHLALYDCFHYLNRLNEYALFFRVPWEFGYEGFFGKDSPL